jgi:hypothetical protein
VDTSAPPTTRTRPLLSRVAVMLPRAVAMLAVAVQLPDGVLGNDPCGVTRGAPANSELEPAPEASARAATASTAQVADPTDLILTKETPSRLDERDEDTQQTLRLSYTSLKPSEALVLATRAPSQSARCSRRARHPRSKGGVRVALPRPAGGVEGLRVS